MIYQTEKKKNITQRKEFNLAAAALVVNGLDAGSRLHVARFAKKQRPESHPSGSPSPSPSLWMHFREFWWGYEFGSCYLALLGLTCMGPPD